MIGVILMVLLVRIFLAAKLTRERWKKLKNLLKWILYLSLMMVHMISFLMMMGAIKYPLQPAMFLENLFTAYSVLVMVYLAVRKYCCHAIPFRVKDKKVQKI